MAAESSGEARWDFFLSHAGPDRQAAVDLRTALRRRKRRVFLAVEEIVPGDPWQVILKQHLSRSDVIVVMVSPNTDAAYYQQEEVALAVDLVRRDAFEHAVVPVLLRGASPASLPFGLSRVHRIEETEGEGIRGVAAALVEAQKTRAKRSPHAALGSSVEAFDEIWSSAEAPFTGRQGERGDPFGSRVWAEGDGLVFVTRRGEQLVTREKLEKRLSPEQLEYVETLERSMEINKALWKKAYPRRVLSVEDRREAEEALTAMRADLLGVLSLLRQAGFWLDDHYFFVRNVLASLPTGAPTGPTGAPTGPTGAPTAPARPPAGGPSG